MLRPLAQQRMTLSDPEWLFPHRAISLRQLSFLFYYRTAVDFLSVSQKLWTRILIKLYTVFYCEK